MAVQPDRLRQASEAIARLIAETPVDERRLEEPWPTVLKVCRGWPLRLDLVAKGRDMAAGWLRERAEHAASNPEDAQRWLDWLLYALAWIDGQVDDPPVIPTIEGRG